VDNISPLNVILVGEKITNKNINITLKILYPINQISIAYDPIEPHSRVYGMS